MHPTPSSPGPSPARARGVTYPIVLAITVMLTVIAMTSVYLSRVSLIVTQGADDWTTAQRLAASGLDHALLEVQAAIATGESTSTDWRLGYTHGAIVRDHPLDDGHFYWKLEDATGDDDLLDDPLDPVYVVAGGEAGIARHTLRARLDAEMVESSNGVGALEVALIADGPINLGSLNVVCDQTIASNTSVTANGASVDAAVEAVGSITGDTYLGSTTTGVARREMPAMSAGQWYLERAEPIDIADLPEANGTRILQRIVLSPTNNPYGAEQPEGIYVIDCENTELSIEHVRIVGTLIVINPNERTKLRQALNWEPALPNYPALMVFGDVKLSLDAIPLDETDTDGKDTNFNPPGTPWQGQTDGVLASDSDQRNAAEGGDAFDPAVHDDLYPSVISGLVAVSGDLHVGMNDSPAFEGVIVVGGQVTSDSGSTLTITYRDTFLLDAPPGFSVQTPGPLRVTTGSVEQIVQP